MERKPWWTGARGEWYVIAQLFVFAAVAAGPWLPTPWPAWGGLAGTAARVLGAALGGIGGLLAMAGLLGLGSANLSPLPHPTDQAVLRQGGVYGLVRHPIYAGLIFGAFGWALLNGSGLTLLLAVGLFVFFDVKARREEAQLCARFADYPAYQAKVRKFIPLVY